MTASFTPRPQIDEDLYRDRIAPALEEIEVRGNLLHFAPHRPERLELMQVLSLHGLIAWNRVLARYELTAAGHEALAEHREKLAGEPRKAAQG